MESRQLHGTCQLPDLRLFQDTAPPAQDLATVIQRGGQVKVHSLRQDDQHNGQHGTLLTAVADAAGRAPKASLSSVIAAHYSPSAAGLMPSLLYMGVPDSALELEVCLYYITMRTCVTRLCSVSCHHCLPDAAHRRARSGQMRCLLSSVHMPCVSQRANSLSL